MIGLGLALVVWLHFRFVVGPLDYANKDFMSLWSGATAVLQGLNPYDEAVWTPLRAAYGSSWMPDPRAPFPLWTFLFLTPFALLPIPAAAALWLTVQELLLVFSAYLIIAALCGRKVNARELGILVLVGFASPSTLLVQINGQMNFLLLAFLALFLVLLDRDRTYLAWRAPHWRCWLLNRIRLSCSFPCWGCGCSGASLGRCVRRYGITIANMNH